MKLSKIVFFSHDAELYGASRSLITLIKGLQARGIECLVVVPYRGPLVEFIKENNIDYFLFYYPSWFYKPIEVPFVEYFKRVLKFVFQTTRFLWHKNLNAKLKGYDLFVSNTSSIPTGALLAMKLGKPHVWYIRELVELHYGFKYILGKKFFLYLIDKTKLRLFNSAFVMNYYLQQLTHKNVNEVIHNGIYPKEKFGECLTDYKASALRQDGTFVFSLIGFIHAGKGQMQAVDAMVSVVQEFKHAKLLIVGSGESAQLQQYINDKGMNAYVILTGYLPDVREIFLQSHCLLNCARYEAFGRTTVEAMAYSLPVIGNNSAGTAEIIQHNHTGLLYNNTTEDLIACMKKLISDPAFARVLGTQGWHEAYEKYNVERYVEKFSDFITKHVPSNR